MLNLHKFLLDPNTFGNIQKLSKIENLPHRFKKLTQRNWKGKRPDTIWRMIKKYIAYLPLQFTVAAPFDIDQIRFYRCRLNIDPDSENLELWSTFSCPPPAYCKVNGRANTAGFPVFYCSDNPTTAIAETRPKTGDVIFHSEWFVRCYRETRRTILFPPNVSKANPWHSIALNKIASEVAGYKETLGEADAENVLTILSFLAELFVSEESPYPISSAIAHKLLFGNAFISADYIVYPSFQVRGNAANLAFHPNFVHQNFLLNKVLKLEVHTSTSAGVEVRHVETGRALYNQIQWGPPHPSELDFLYSNHIS